MAIKYNGARAWIATITAAGVVGGAVYFGATAPASSPSGSADAAAPSPELQTSTLAAADGTPASNSTVTKAPTRVIPTPVRAKKSRGS